MALINHPMVLLKASFCILDNFYIIITEGEVENEEKDTRMRETSS